MVMVGFWLKAWQHWVAKNDGNNGWGMGGDLGAPVGGGSGGDGDVRE